MIFVISCYSEFTHVHKKRTMLSENKGWSRFRMISDPTNQEGSSREGEWRTRREIKNIIFYFKMCVT